MSNTSSYNTNNQNNHSQSPQRLHRKTLSGTSSFTISSSTKPRSTSQEPGNPLRASATSPKRTDSPPPQAQKPIRRSLSFQIPLKVSTDSSRFAPSRSRARSLPPEHDKKPPVTAHSRGRYSLSAISQSPLTTSKPIYVAESSSSVDETTPTEQFLQARGLPTTEPQDQSSVEAAREQVVKYLTTMSTP